MPTSAATPISEFLLKTNSNLEKPKEKQKKYFHTTVERVLFITKRDRPDIHTSITYLYMRVKEPNTNDWKKLRRMIMYLVGTTELVLRLKVDHVNVLK